jgi:hypothetical protein
MPPFGGPLGRLQACMNTGATGYSGKLNHSDHFDSVFKQYPPNQFKILKSVGEP